MAKKKKHTLYEPLPFDSPGFHNNGTIEKALIHATSDIALLVDVSGIIICTNECWARIFNIDPKQAIGKNVYDFFPPHIAKDRKKIAAEVIKLRKPVRYHDKQSSGEYVSSIFPVFNKKGNVYRLAIFVEDRDTLAQARKELEEIKEKVKQQEKLIQKKEAVLDEIFQQIEMEKKRLRHRVQQNAESLLLPIIERLKLKNSAPEYIHLLEKNLRDLTKSFGMNITSQKNKLTAKEIEICNMIKNGLSTKEIARIQNSSVHTIEKHRLHIRKKLGLAKNKTGLSAHLTSL